jgi:methionyl-tRNA formyltransferase
MIKKEEGQLDFSLPAVVLERKVRAYHPWPGAFTEWDNQVLKIHRVHTADFPGGQAGKRLIHEGQPAILTGEGILMLDELQLAGRNIQSGKAFLNGVRNWSE